MGIGMNNKVLISIQTKKFISLAFGIVSGSNLIAGIDNLLLYTKIMYFVSSMFILISFALNHR